MYIFIMYIYNYIYITIITDIYKYKSYHKLHLWKVKSQSPPYKPHKSHMKPASLPPMKTFGSC